jgi:hypothetical protein
MEQAIVPLAASQLYPILASLTPEDRLKATRAVLAMFGETLVVDAPSDTVAHSETFAGTEGEPVLGSAARRWIQQQGLTMDALAEVFDFSDGNVVLLAADLPGSSKKDLTVNSYLLAGIAALLRKDEPTFGDDEAVTYCKIVGGYDQNNHTSNRRSIGNRITGDRRHGFRLTAPGLRDAAMIIKALSRKVLPK